MSRSPRHSPASPGGSIDEAELAKFAAVAHAWWDPDGAFRPLHQLNPVRLAFIRDQIAGLHGRDPLAPHPLRGLRILDIGCGGGLLSEPLARMGGEVLGIDATEQNVDVAKEHARASELACDYRHATAEELAAEGAMFDVVISMEVVEHVPDAGAFIAAAGALVRPGGALVLSTLNRTIKAFALAVVGAEYLLRWLPRGTHDWRRFVRPSEMAAALRRAGFELRTLTGVSYNPITDSWGLSPDLGVNYMALALRPGA
ncbi:MAG: bifunctional 2-polyprenyl-6-hydroxyphenol methylase/3-demethylubiquinol 3-O-methyltransferase UbiG [Alphaproteobacteria bacterium]